MSTITSLTGTDGITTANSMTKINTNFSNLNTDKIETSVIDSDTALTANSDTKIATQKAVKAYVDTGGNVNASETSKGIVEEATDAEVTAGTATGATGAKLFVTPAKLATIRTTDLATGLTKIGETILGGNATTIAVTVAAYKHLRIYVDILGATGNYANAGIRFNADTGANYGYNYHRDVAAFTAATGATYIALSDFIISTDIFIVMDVFNTLALQKSVISTTMGHAGTSPPIKISTYGNWNNTAAQITTVTLMTSGAESFLTGSRVTVYGAN